MAAQRRNDTAPQPAILTIQGHSLFLLLHVQMSDRSLDAASRLFECFPSQLLLYLSCSLHCRTSAWPMSASRSGRLAASRQAQAFQALFERDISDDEESVLDGRHSSRKAGAAKERRDQRRGRASVPVAGFSLRDGASEVDQAAANTADEVVSQLRQMFPTADPFVLTDVSTACGGSLNSAVDALLAMNLAEEPAQPSTQPVLSGAGAPPVCGMLLRASPCLDPILCEYCNNT
jgi:hypothetical protein